MTYFCRGSFHWWTRRLHTLPASAPPACTVIPSTQQALIHVTRCEYNAWLCSTSGTPRSLCRFWGMLSPRARQALVFVAFFVTCLLAGCLVSSCRGRPTTACFLSCCEDKLATRTELLVLYRPSNSSGGPLDSPRETMSAVGHVSRHEYLL